MPSLETHCAISKQRTNNEFRELHKWIDEPQQFMKHNHRLERHSFNDWDKHQIEEKWGEKGVVEWLFHIALDNLETAHKFAIKAYQPIRPFDTIEVGFKDGEISFCDCKKDHPNSISIKRYEKDVQSKHNSTIGISKV